ncbi:unnamed protein product [Ixodes hexagonus]
MSSRDGYKSPYSEYVVVRSPNEARGSRSTSTSRRRSPKYAYESSNYPRSSRASIVEDDSGNQSLLRMGSRGKVIYLEELQQPQGRRMSRRGSPVGLLRKEPQYLRFAEDGSLSFSEEEPQQPRIVRVQAPRRAYEDEALPPQIIRLARTAESARSEGTLPEQQPMVIRAPRMVTMPEEGRTSPQMVRVIDPRGRGSISQAPPAIQPCEDCIQELMRSRSRSMSRRW